MAAITMSVRSDRGRPQAVRHARALPQSVYWQRRVAVILVIAGAFLAGGKALDALGGGPLTAAEASTPAPAGVASVGPSATADAPPIVRLETEPVSRSTYVVRSGDTLWTIARRMQPSGDVRPLVDALAAARDGRPLQPGERIVLP